MIYSLMGFLCKSDTLHFKVLDGCVFLLTFSKTKELTQEQKYRERIEQHLFPLK